MENEPVYTTITLRQTVPLDSFRAGLVDVPRFMGYCLECPNQGKWWSCPPFAFDPMDIWNRYFALELYAKRITFTKNRLFPQERRRFEREDLPRIKRGIMEELLAMEVQIPGSLALFPGKCEWCSQCARAQGLPCRHPERLRYSIEALGGDCGGALEKHFGETLQWAHGEALPERLILLGGLLLPDDPQTP